MFSETATLIRASQAECRTLSRRRHGIKGEGSLPLASPMATIPDAADIDGAIQDLAAGLTLDPDAVGVDRAWCCVVVDVLSGKQLSAGFGLTKNEAAGAAWVACLPVARLVDAILRRTRPPLPDGRVRLVLARPGCWERVMSEQRHRTS